MKNIDLASCFPFIRELSPANRRQIESHSRVIIRKKGETLLFPGTPVNGAYLVLEGCLDVFTVSVGGKESVLYQISTGESCFFALNALFNDIAYPAWVRVASKTVKLCIVNGLTIRKLFGSEPAVRQWAWEVQSSRVFDLMSTMEEILHCPLRQRLSRFLLRAMNRDQIVSHTHESIATHLNSTREVISRNLKQLESEGLIVLRRGSIHIKSPEQLREQSLS